MSTVIIYKDREIVLGEDYETYETLLKKTGLTNVKSLYARIKVLTKRGTPVIKMLTPETREVFFLREDADRIINYSQERERPVIKGYMTVRDILSKCGDIQVDTIYKRIYKLRDEDGIEISPSFYKKKIAYYKNEDAEKIINM